MTYTDPNVSYYQQVQANLAPVPNNNTPTNPTGFTSIGPSTNFTGPETPPQTVTGAIAAQNAPALAQQGLQYAGIEQQLGDLGPSLQLQGDYATQMAGYQLGGLGINTQQTALQQQGAEQRYGLQQQGFAQQQAQQALQFQNQMQGIVGGEAASGALNTEGSKQQQSTAQQENVFAGQSLGRQEQLSAGDYARAQQNYGLIGQANGLGQQEVYTRLQSGLQQLGESADPTSLVAQAGGLLSGESTGVGGTLSQAGLLGGLNALAGLG